MIVMTSGGTADGDSWAVLPVVPMTRDQMIHQIDRPPTVDRPEALFAVCGEPAVTETQSATGGQLVADHRPPVAG